MLLQLLDQRFNHIKWYQALVGAGSVKSYDYETAVQEWRYVLRFCLALQDATGGGMSNTYCEAVHASAIDADWLIRTYSACAVVRVRADVIVHIVVKDVLVKLG